MSILFYKRPEYVLESNEPLCEGARTGRTGGNCSIATIPPELCFENVVCNKCMPPCSLQDILEYLTYVTHDAENLQFYLWMVDYSQRFRNAPKAEKALSPRWRRDRITASRTDNRGANEALSSVDARDLDPHSEELSNGSTWDGTQSEFTDDYTQTMNSLKLSILPLKHSVGCNALQWQINPDVQPFRAEINRMVTHYIAPGSPRQLNLSHNDRADVLRALEQTTHPSALRVVKRMLDSTLRNQSHPNFVRWSVCNGNKQWTSAIFLTLSKYSRWWRIFAAFEWWFGITSILAASQGLCVLLHRMRTRQYHAWETGDRKGKDDDDEAVLKGLDSNFISYEATKSKWPVKMEVFGPANNYSTEAWVDHYDRKSWLRKLFERRVSVQEAGLKATQNRMIRQAEVWALIMTVPLTVAFVAIPKGNLYPD